MTIPPGPHTLLFQPPSERIMQLALGGDVKALRELQGWYSKIWYILGSLNGIAWDSIAKAGSTLADIETRTHDLLQEIEQADDTSASVDAGKHVTDALVKKYEDHRNASQNVHGIGVGSSVVGTATAQVISNKKYGGADHYTEFEADGTLHMVGDATNWNDINKALLPLSIGVNVPSIIAVNGASHLKVRAFNGNATMEELGEGCEILHDYKEGTDIQPHLHWAATTADAGNVKWQLAYMWINRDGTYSGETIIDVTVAASEVAWKEQRTNFPAISGTGKEIGSRFQFVLFRDPADVADTYAHDAAAFDFGIHYERDTIGSREITTK
jgi:hypothetical protein